MISAVNFVSDYLGLNQTNFQVANNAPQVDPREALIAMSKATALNTQAKDAIKVQALVTADTSGEIPIINSEKLSDKMCYNITFSDGTILTYRPAGEQDGKRDHPRIGHRIGPMIDLDKVPGFNLEKFDSAVKATAKRGFAVNVA